MRRLLLALTVAAAVAALALLTTASSAGQAAPDPLLPDLRTLAPSQLKVEYNGSTGQRLLRFTNTVWNGGQGPLELRGVFNPASGKTRVWQRIYHSDGSIQERFVGEFVFHPGHNHWHFENFALYELWSLTASGALNTVVATSGKVTFCIIDTTHVDPGLPGSPKQAVYSSCGQALQGLSVGWGDAYPWYLVGQSLNITSLANGKYALKSTADPRNLLWESDDANNAAITCIRLRNRSVQVVQCP